MSAKLHAMHQNGPCDQRSALVYCVLRAPVVRRAGWSEEVAALAAAHGNGTPRRVSIWLCGKGG